MKKKISAIILATVLVIGAIFTLVSCDWFGGQDEAAAFVSLDINPSIEFTLDKNNKVLSVYGANEDGQVLLYEEDGIVGADIEVATAKVLELAKQLGYVSEENTVVQTTVTTEKGDKEDALYNKINAQVEASAESLNIALKCEANTAYSLMRKLEQLKAQYPDNQAIQNLSPAKLKLVISAAETGEISVEAAAEMNNAELIKAVSATHEKMEAFATEAYKQAKSVASAIYDEAVGTLTEGVYTAYYAKSVLQLKHLDTCYLGALYQSYKMGYRVLNATAKALVFVEKINDYALNAQQIEAVLNAFGSSVTVDDLKNSDGEVTLNSIYAYADKTFKNSQAAADLTELKNKLNAALDTIDSELKVKIDEAAQKYAPQIEAITNAINSVINSLPDAFKDLSQTVFGDLQDMCNAIADILKDGKITSDEVRALANSINGKAAATLTRIEKDLDKDELAEIQESLDGFKSKTDAFKQQMDEAIAKAEQEAKTKLEQIKASRQSK